MTPAAGSAVALLMFIALTGSLAAYRRRRSSWRGYESPESAFGSLRWGAALRRTALAVALVLLTVVVIADPYPLATRLFPEADPIGREQIVLSFHEVLAASIVGVAAVAAFADAAVTFVQPAPLRRGLLGICSVGVAACTAYGALFVGALAIS